MTCALSGGQRHFTGSAKLVYHLIVAVLSAGYEGAASGFGPAGIVALALGLGLLAFGGGCGFIGYERIAPGSVDNDGVSGGEATTTGALEEASNVFLPGVGATARQALSVCGDGIVEGDEPCDDGGPSDVCHANCTPATCDAACECALEGVHFVMVCPQPESFDDAEARCRSQGLRVFEVHDIDDQARLEDVLATHDLDAAWLGATELVDDNEVIGWRSQTAGFWRRDAVQPGPLNGAFHAWEDNQPRASRELDDCIRIARNTGGWRSTDCSIGRPVICEGFQQSAEVDIHSLAYDPGTRDLHLAWRSEGPRSVLTSYRIVLSGADQQTHTVSADFTSATLPVAPEARGLVAITVIPMVGEVAGLPALQRAVPAQGVWIEAVSQPGEPALNGIMRFGAHHLSLLQTTSDGVELPTFGNDHINGESDATRHYIVGTFKRRLIELLEAEKARSGRQVSFGLTYFDNNDYRFGIQTIGGRQDGQDAQHDRTATQRFLSYFIDVTSDDLSHLSGNRSFRLTPYNWHANSDEPLFVHHIVLRDGL